MTGPPKSDNRLSRLWDQGGAGLAQVRQLNYFSIYFRDPGMVAGWFLDRYGG